MVAAACHGDRGGSKGPPPLGLILMGGRLVGARQRCRHRLLLLLLLLLLRLLQLLLVLLPGRGLSNGLQLMLGEVVVLLHLAACRGRHEPLSRQQGSPIWMSLRETLLVRGRRGDRRREQLMVRASAPASDPAAKWM